MLLLAKLDLINIIIISEIEQATDKNFDLNRSHVLALFIGHQKIMLPLLCGR